MEECGGFFLESRVIEGAPLAVTMIECHTNVGKDFGIRTLQQALDNRDRVQLIGHGNPMLTEVFDERPNLGSKDVYGLATTLSRGSQSVRRPRLLCEEVLDLNFPKVEVIAGTGCRELGKASMVGCWFSMKLARVACDIRQ